MGITASLGICSVDFKLDKGASWVVFFCLFSVFFVVFFFFALGV